jgi:dTDP-4-amino-4,6-dideoxygalactose transaminase
MNIEFNVLDRQFLKYQKEYESAAIRVLHSGWYILGKELESFETEFANYIGSSHCVGLNSGLDALILAFRALGIKEGDEVLVPANTYIASVIGITENKATPVFIEPDEYHNIDVSKIEQAITNKTKAILVVNLYGQSANLNKIKEIADKHNLYLLEDCAQSHGAKFEGKMTGTFGDIGCFSFYPTKNLGAFGDSGAIVTDNPEIFEKIKMLRNYGSKIKYYNEIQGINSRLDEIQAALLRVKLTHLEELREERTQNALRYLKGINNTLIELPKIREGSEHVWHLFVVYSQNRDHLQKYLLEHNIKTAIHYPVPPHLADCYKELNIKKGTLPITEDYANKILSLPLYDGMTSDEVDYVIDKINSYKE